MIVCIEQLLALISDPEIRMIIGLSQREITRPEGAGFDLRVGKLFRFRRGSIGYLYVDRSNMPSRKTPECDLVCEFDPSRDAQEIVAINPGDFYLIQTIERFRMPENLLGIVVPRTTLFRSGIILLASVVSPGYGLSEQNGAALTFGLANIGGHLFKLEMGARIAHIVFAKIDGKAALYRGPWQENGGRVWAEPEEQN
jgi:deoxycytidine triphosphate deaminase